MASVNDKLSRVSDSDTGRPVIAQLVSPGKSIGASSVSVNDATNWTTLTKIHFVIYATKQVSGVVVKDTSTQTEWTGTLAGTTISNLVLTGGTDQTYLAGAYVELTPTAKYAKDLYDGLATTLNPDGTLKDGAINSSSKLTDSIVSNTKISDGAVSYVKLLSTIFSSQIQTQANSGTAGGTISYINLGGIKLAWGITGLNTPNANTQVIYTVVFPVGFFTAITSLTFQDIQASGGTANNWLIGNAYSNANFSFYINNTTNSNGVGGIISWFAIGN